MNNVEHGKTKHNIITSAFFYGVETYTANTCSPNADNLSIKHCFYPNLYNMEFIYHTASEIFGIPLQLNDRYSKWKLDLSSFMHLCCSTSAALKNAENDRGVRGPTRRLIIQFSASISLTSALKSERPRARKKCACLARGSTLNREIETQAFLEQVRARARGHARGSKTDYRVR